MRGENPATGNNTVLTMRDVDQLTHLPGAEFSLLYIA